jgi:hypothetical protein
MTNDIVKYTFSLFIRFENCYIKRRGYGCDLRFKSSCLTIPIEIRYTDGQNVNMALIPFLKIKL